MWVVITLATLAAADLKFSTSLNVTGALNTDSLTTDKVYADSSAVIDMKLTADSVTSSEVVSNAVTLNSLNADRVLIEGDLMIVQASSNSTTTTTTTTTTTSFIELGRSLQSHSDFERGKDGWTGSHTDDCLGTHVQSSCTSPQVKKSFSLPSHTHITIEASFHMLGEWLNDSAFLKVDDNIVWMESGRTGSLKTCHDSYDARLGVPISVKLPHVSHTANLEFGSTLETCSGSFSVAEVRVYVN
mmetsp:Transcript_22675/g.40820  ORF Transcript_22675/g.40820 Transcript_22675/m.40820 type:complete len:244 (-) Transcript_22675:30-761(-)